MSEDETIVYSGEYISYEGFWMTAVETRSGKHYTYHHLDENNNKIVATQEEYDEWFKQSQRKSVYPDDFEEDIPF